MKPAFLLDLLYECYMCKADLRGDPLPVVITIRAGSRDFTFSHRTRMRPEGGLVPDHVSCPACGMLFVFDNWSSVITDSVPIDDLLPGGSPDDEVDLVLGLISAFGNFESFNAQVTEGLAAGGPVPQSPEFARLVTRLAELERAGMGGSQNPTP